MVHLTPSSMGRLQSEAYGRYIFSRLHVGSMGRGGGLKPQPVSSQPHLPGWAPGGLAQRWPTQTGPPPPFEGR